MGRERGGRRGGRGREGGRYREGEGRGDEGGREKKQYRSTGRSRCYALANQHNCMS